MPEIPPLILAWLKTTNESQRCLLIGHVMSLCSAGTRSAIANNIDGMVTLMNRFSREELRSLGQEEIQCALKRFAESGA